MMGYDEEVEAGDQATVGRIGRDGGRTEYTSKR